MLNSQNMYQYYSSFPIAISQEIVAVSVWLHGALNLCHKILAIIAC